MGARLAGLARVAPCVLLGPRPSLAPLLIAARMRHPFFSASRVRSLLLMLAFYWLVAAALLLFAYCLSTLFSKARVAGGAAAVLYSLAMMPGWAGRRDTLSAKGCCGGTAGPAWRCWQLAGCKCGAPVKAGETVTPGAPPPCGAVPATPCSWMHRRHRRLSPPSSPPLAGT